MKSNKDRVIGKSIHKLIAIISFIILLILVSVSIKNFIVGFKQDLWTYLYHLFFLINSVVFYRKYRIIYFEKDRIRCVRGWNKTILFELKYDEITTFNFDRGRGVLLYEIRGKDKTYRLETSNVFKEDLIRFLEENNVVFTNESIWR